MKIVRQASMVQRAAPLRRLVTLTPVKLKAPIDRTVMRLVACSDRDTAISCAQGGPVCVISRFPVTFDRHQELGRAGICAPGRRPFTAPW